VVLVVDANVLIDYLKADESVLALMVRHVGPVYVPRDVLDEVQQLDQATCARLGLHIADGSLEQLIEAGQGGGGLSFTDRVCLVLARDNGWVCVTNDRRLRRACEQESVESWWGLELLLEVVDAGGLKADTAIEVAETIGRMNRWIAGGVVATFVKKVRRT
jgi:predicted nucleic acid-binding protein